MRRIEAMDALVRKAGIVLEAENYDQFRLLKLTGKDAQETASGDNGYLNLIPKHVTGSSLAILIIPGSEFVHPPQDRIMDEVILDVRDAMKMRGYGRFVVAARCHGPPVQIYTDGLPSRKQVAEKKRSWNEVSAAPRSSNHTDK